MEVFLSLFSAHDWMVALETHSVHGELWGTAAGTLTTFHNSGTTGIP